MHDHDKLSRVFSRATDRYMRRSNAYHYRMLCGRDAAPALELARQAVALVARLGALHPSPEQRVPEHGPLHRTDE